MVLAPCDARRLLREVEYVTSPGHSVLTVVTDRCTLERASRTGPWTVTELAPGLGVHGAEQEIASRCPWSLTFPDSLGASPPPSELEWRFLMNLNEPAARALSAGGARANV